MALFEKRIWRRWFLEIELERWYVLFGFQKYPSTADLTEIHSPSFVNDEED